MLTSPLSDFIPVDRISLKIAEKFLVEFVGKTPQKTIEHFYAFGFAQIDIATNHLPINQYPLITPALNEAEMEKIAELRARIYHTGAFAVERQVERVASIITNGAENYGNWEIMEIMEKYGETAGQMQVIKHLLRKPRADRFVGASDAEKVARIQDLKKALNYLSREVDILEGRYVSVIK